MSEDFRFELYDSQPTNSEEKEQYVNEHKYVDLSKLVTDICTELKNPESVQEIRPLVLKTLQKLRCKKHYNCLIVDCQNPIIITMVMFIIEWLRDANISYDRFRVTVRLPGRAPNYAPIFNDVAKVCKSNGIICPTYSINIRPTKNMFKSDELVAQNLLLQAILSNPNIYNLHWSQLYVHDWPTIKTFINFGHNLVSLCISLSQWRANNLGKFIDMIPEHLPNLRELAVEIKSGMDEHILSVIDKISRINQLHSFRLWVNRFGKEVNIGNCVSIIMSVTRLLGNPDLVMSKIDMPICFQALSTKEELRPYHVALCKAFADSKSIYEIGDWQFQHADIATTLIPIMNGNRNICEIPGTWSCEKHDRDKINEQIQKNRDYRTQWIRISLLLSFVRANLGSSLIYSILPLIKHGIMHSV